MMHKAEIRLIALAACLLVATAAGANAATGNVEKRLYEILIDGKPAGSYQLTLSRGVDGSVNVDSQADVAHKIFWHDYKYTYRGRESWKNDRLVSLDSDSTDDGKRCVVHAGLRNDGWHVNINGKEKIVTADLFSSSYWQVPPSAPPEFGKQFLEVDSGRVFKGTFKRLSEDRLTIAEKPEVCQHYRLSGGDEGDLWYDSEHRLVKQSSSDGPVRTTVVLKTKTQL